MRVHSGLWAVLFTDLVESTARRVELGDRAADAIVASHDRIVLGALAIHGGTLVKGTGDGAMCAFRSARAALVAGAEILAAASRTAHDDAPVELRIGASVGELSSRGDDLFGIAVNEAARVCAAALPGEFLVTTALAALGEDSPVRFGGSRELRLKGFDGPTHVRSVSAAVAPDAHPSGLPSTLRVALDGLPFEGRQQELADALDVVDTARAGHGGLLVFSGPAGIGKSRLAAEIARRAAQGGFAVLHGGCHSHLLAPFAPFAEALRQHVASVGVHGLGPAPDVLLRLVSGSLEETSLGSVEGEAEAHRLTTAIAGWLTALARSRPVLFVVDDLQWASRSTVALLRQVVQAASALPLLLVGTLRDLADGPPPLLDELLQLGMVSRRPLVGLDSFACRRLVSISLADSAGPMPTDLEDLLVDGTGGNPLFLTALLASTGAPDEVAAVLSGRAGLPTDVGDAVRSWLVGATDQERETLEIAAVCGPEFTPDLVCRLVDTDRAGALRALDRLEARNLVRGSPAGGYRFAHGLIRSAVLEGMGRAARSDAHARTALVLQERDRPDVAVIAHHWRSAGPLGDWSQALEWTERAARQAISGGAFDVAADQCVRALELAETCGASAARTASVQVVLSQARRLLGAKDYTVDLYRAIDAAAQAGLVETVVEGALALSRGTLASVGVVDAGRVSTLRRALELVGARSSASRARLLCRLATELMYGSVEERKDLRDEALAIAEAHQDAQLWIEVGLDAAECLYHDLDTRRSVQLHLDAALAGDGGEPLDPVRRWFVHARGRAHAFMSCDMDRAEWRLGEMQVALDEVPFAFGRWYVEQFRAVHAIVHGELSAALEHSAEALAEGEASGQPEALMAHIGVQSWVGGERDTCAETLDLVDGLVASLADAPGAPFFRSFAAWDLAHAHQLERAHALLCEEAAAGFSFTDQTNLTLTYLVNLAEVAVWTRDLQACSALYERLAAVPNQMTNPGGVTVGCTAQQVGRLATVLGDFASAARALASAEETYRAAGAPLFLARTLVDRAALARADDDGQGAGELVDQAMRIAEERGAAGMATYVQHAF